MNTDALFQVLSSIKEVSTDFRRTFEPLIVEERLPKRHLLLCEGQVCRRIYFVKEGFARAYYYSGSKEFTTWFMGTGEIVISVYSFFTQRPSFEFIELLENSTLQSISWQELQELYSKFPDFNFIGRIITEQYYIRSEETAIQLRTLSASERYQTLIKKYPAFLQHTPLIHIASHLGISPETLSRIRAKKEYINT